MNFRSILPKLLLTLFLTSFAMIGMNYAQADKETEDFYDVEKIREVRITFRQSNWQNILDSLRITSDKMLIATATIDGKSYKNIGVRIAQSKAFAIGEERNSLDIDLAYVDESQHHLNQPSLRLSNALRDPSMVREVLSYEIARKYMAAPRANYAKLYINDKYRGVFVNVEPINEAFLKHNFKEEGNPLFKCLSEGEMPEKQYKYSGCLKGVLGSLRYEENAECYMDNFSLSSKKGWGRLIDLTETLNKDIKNIEEKLDVDQVLWMHAFNNVLVNLNSYAGDFSQNYYLYQKENGQFVPVIWDMNLSFGSYKNYAPNTSSLSLEQLQTLDPFLHADNKLKPLISQLLKEPYYRKVYVAHLKTILQENFLNNYYEERAKELQRLISNDLFKDPYRQYEHNEFLTSLDNTIGKRSKIPGIVELMSKRARFLKKHDQLRNFPPSVDNVNFARRERFAAKGVGSYKIQAEVDNRPKKVEIFYRFSESEDYKSTLMYDDGKHNDEKAGDKIFGIEIKPNNGQPTMQYYIIAEGALDILFYPSDYTKNPATMSLEELNK